MTDLIGQQEPLAAALAALRRGRVAHAHMIVGPPGSGKGALAESIACAQLCMDPREDGMPCRACKACALASAGAHPDLHWVGPEGRLGIDEVRGLSRAAVLAPHSAPCSVFVVEACERITPPAAAALLKTLEEPVAPVLFLLLAEHPDQLEPTLRSRCLQIRLRPVPLDALIPWLAAARPDVPEPQRNAAARAARGLPGQALRLLDAEPDEVSAAQLCAGLMADTPAQVIEAASALAAAGVSPEVSIAALRDAWIRRYGLADDITPASSLSAERLAELVRALPTAFDEVAAAAMDARAAEDANVNPSLNWQILLYRLRRARSAC